MHMPEAAAAGQPTTFPSTVDYIAYHAANQPEAVALIDNGREFTYATFYRDIGKMVTALRGFGLTAGDVAGVEHRAGGPGVPYFYLHWLALLGFEALGVATLSYARNEASVGAETLAALDLVMCFPGDTPPGAKQLQSMDGAWIERVLAGPPQGPVAAAPIDARAALRMVKSSGTTGTPKQMIQTGWMQNSRVALCQFRIGFTRHSRYLLPLGFTVQAYHHDAMACIRMGGACVYEDARESLAEALATYAITHVTLLPQTLIRLLDSLPGDYQKPAALTVMTIGGPVSKAVRARVKRRLTDDLMETYSTNETSTICVIGEDGAGRLLPGVRAQVVDDGG